MNFVKTYNKIHSEKEMVHFGMSKMEDIYVKRNGQSDVPHRHNYYTVLIIKQAKGSHIIDFNSYELSEKQLFFIAPGQVHQIIETEKPKGYAMTFSNQFLIENSIPLAFISSLNLFQSYGQTPPLLTNKKQFKLIENFTNQVFTYATSNAQMKDLSIGAYLKLLLIECNNICSINPIETEIDSSGDHLIRKFKESVDAHFKKEHATSFYANVIHITTDHLTRTVKNKIGQTAKQYIQSRIITEAKRLLYFTELSNKEIGYELGFNAPANFSAFFKKHTQLSPSSFKKRENKS
ncbi:helix-turn-helix domain-containing protein [Polaribacter irgensii]|nr:helix-turn-helix domain-containing protein [Polaribacter irgensii]